MRTYIGGMALFLAAVVSSSAAWGEECAACAAAETGTCATCEAAADIGSACNSACNNACCSSPLGICGLEYNGYLNAGGTFNDHGQNYNFTHANSDNTFGFDGAYLSVLKKAQNGCGCADWGFGADVMFGRDAKFFSSYKGWDDNWETGHNRSDFNGYDLGASPESYGFAAPQLYGEVSANYWTFKGGRFYTLMGYEGARADQRFFYTFGRNFEMTPITHSGALATYSGFENLDFTVGWVMGENNMFEQDYDESLITGAVNLHRGDDASAKYTFLAGDGMMSGRSGKLFRNDVTLQRKLNCRWDAALAFNYGSLDEMSGTVSGISGCMNDLLLLNPAATTFEYQTWAGFLYYTLNDCWKLGTRIEWQKGSLTGTGMTADVETTSLTFGANWTPLCNDNFVVRPEIRYDDCSIPIFGQYVDRTTPFTYTDQLSLGIDLLCKF